MARVLKKKELVNTRLAANYGGWMYCTNCNENIGYLCYVTYDKLDLNYTCKCGSCGSISIEIEEDGASIKDNNNLVLIKNRLCCPNDESPLITILTNKLDNYNFEIVCNSCKKRYYESSSDK